MLIHSIEKSTHELNPSHLKCKISIPPLQVIFTYPSFKMGWSSKNALPTSFKPNFQHCPNAVIPKQILMIQEYSNINIRS